MRKMANINVQIVYRKRPWEEKVKDKVVPVCKHHKKNGVKDSMEVKCNIYKHTIRQWWSTLSSSSLYTYNKMEVNEFSKNLEATLKF